MPLHAINIDAIVKPFWEDTRVQFFCFGVCGCLFTVSLVFSAACLISSWNAERRPTSLSPSPHQTLSFTSAVVMRETPAHVYARVPNSDVVQSDTRSQASSSTDDVHRSHTEAITRNEEDTTGNTVAAQLPPLRSVSSDHSLVHSSGDVSSHHSTRESSACAPGISEAEFLHVTGASPASPLASGSREVSRETFTPSHALLSARATPLSRTSPPESTTPAATPVSHHPKACTPVTSLTPSPQWTLEASALTCHGETSSDGTDSSPLHTLDVPLSSHCTKPQSLAVMLATTSREMERLCEELAEAEEDMLESTAEVERRLRLLNSQHTVEQGLWIVRLGERLMHSSSRASSSPRATPRQGGQSPRVTAPSLQ